MAIDIDVLLSQDYPIEMEPVAEKDGHRYWVAEIPLLKGCIAVGDTKEEALRILDEAKRAWIEDALSMEEEVPILPSHQLEVSGKFTLRLPKTMHRELIRDARREGVSLNQFVLWILAGRERVKDSATVQLNIARIILDAVSDWNNAAAPGLLEQSSMAKEMLSYE
ncbi:MAG: toxin-antitoxin system HicB family antitoxin [Thermaerobacter sp.]|nr:toxin-antitoxin system HicB family antitoxin [Thermaerobacter sp.]